MSRVNIKKGNKGFIIRFALKDENYSDAAGYTSTVTIWSVDDDDFSITKIVDGGSCSAAYDGDAYGGTGATYVDYTVTSSAVSSAGDYYGEINFTKDDIIRDTKTFMWKVKQGSR